MLQFSILIRNYCFPMYLYMIQRNGMNVKKRLISVIRIYLNKKISFRIKKWFHLIMSKKM